MTGVDRQGGKQAAINVMAEMFGRVPGRFRIAQALGPRYSLRCVVFHDICDEESPFTKGLDITISRSRFEAALQFLTKHYTPVRLRDILADPDGRNLPPRPVLVTFDDGYASVAEFAAPLCSKYGVPAIFFINASCLDNKQLGLDNLICYATNTVGLPAINELAKVITGSPALKLNSMAEIFSRFLPTVSLELRDVFYKSLLNLVSSKSHVSGHKAALYLTSRDVRRLAEFDFEIGNHTYSHVHCRLLSQQTISEEIDRNKAELEASCGREIHSFSLPYGRAADLTDELVRHLALSGHKIVFLSESVANVRHHNAFKFDRVSARAHGDAYLFTEIEILPRLRALRNLLVHSRN